jgi:uncharacterized membrane protein
MVQEKIMPSQAENENIIYFSTFRIGKFMSHYFFIKQTGAYSAAFTMSIVYSIVLIITAFFIYKQVVPVLKGKKVSEYYDHHD